MTFPQSWEKFNEWYSNEVDLLRKDIIDNDKLYDPQTDSITFRGYTLSVKKAKYYSPPPGLAEFCKTVGHIIKPHAHKITVRIKYFSSLYYTYWDQDVQINYMDWLGFLSDNIGGYIYINCNPESLHYGNIIVENQELNRARIVYKNIHELIADIGEWMTVTGELPDFDIDEFLDQSSKYYEWDVGQRTSPQKTLSNREVLTSDNPVRRGWATNVNWELKAKLLYKDRKHHSFHSWVWAKHVEN